MIRVLIITINLFLAWMAAIFSGGIPAATVSAPATVGAGESFVVSVKISPNGVEDFLRYSMNIPAGWNAEKISDDGATFMFENQVVKFLWSRVGKREELNISYKLIPPAGTNGTFEMPCKVSHTVNNLPSHVQLTPLSVVMGNPSGNQQGDYQPEKTDSTATPSVIVTGTRILPQEPVTGEFLVDVTINKGELKNFIKLQDSLPAGFTARPVMNDGGDFSFENGVVRIQWYAPSKTVTSLHVQYKVIVAPDAEGTYPVSGHLSYVENMQNKIVSIPTASVTLKANPALAAQNNGNNNTGNTNVQQNANNTTNEQPVANNQTKEQEPQNTGNTVNKSEEPAANNSPVQPAATSGTPGVSFKVQIAAMQRLVPASYYKNTYGLSSVDVEQVDGLNKYTTGKFDTYKDARDQRETVKNKGVAGPFVTAYSNGKRITVQEALMITSQKWIR